MVPVQEWDGWYQGEYGEDFATSWDEAQIMAWNLHLLLAGFESFDYPPIEPPFRVERRFTASGEAGGSGAVAWE